MTVNSPLEERKPRWLNTDYLWLATPPGKPIPLGRRICHPILRFLLFFLVKVKVQGLEYFPKQGPTMVIYNHLHYLDPNIMAGHMPRYTVPLSKEENFAVPVQGWLLYSYGAIGVKRGEIDRVALRAAQAVLEAGNVLMVAPEGTRSKTGGLLEAHSGLAFMAQRMEGTVIQPVGQWGAETFGSHIKRLQRTPVTLNFGPPFRFRKPEKRSREALQEMTNEAMYQIAALLPPQYRGVYSDLGQATTHWLEFLSPTVSEL